MFSGLVDAFGIRHALLNNTKADAGTSPGVKHLTVLPCLEAQG